MSTPSIPDDPDVAAAYARGIAASDAMLRAEGGVMSAEAVSVKVVVVVVDQITPTCDLLAA